MSKTGNCTAPRGLAHRLLVLIISFFPAPNALALGVHVGGGHALEGPRPIVAPLLLSPLRWNSHPCLSCSVAARSRAQSNHLSSARPLRQKHAPPPHMMSPTHTKDLTRWCPPSGPPAVYPLLIHSPCLPPPRSANLSPLCLLLRLPQNGERERASFPGAHCIQVRTSQCRP